MRTLLLLLIQISCSAQIMTPGVGARSTALGGVSATNGGQDAAWSNPSAMTEIQKTTWQTTYQQHANLPGANRMATALMVPVANFRFAASFFRFGDELYHEQMLSFGMAHQVGQAAIGASAQVEQQGGDGLANRHILTLRAGTQVALTQQLTLCVILANLTQQSWNNLPAPFRIAAGAQIRFSEQVRAVAEVDIVSGQSPLIRMGTEYKIRERASLRCGLILPTAMLSAGFGFRSGRMGIDVACTNHVALGLSTEVGMSYQMQ